MRKVVTVVVALAVVWAIPAARTHVVATAHPALERLGPAASFMIEPARREATKKQMNAMLRVAANDLSEGRRVPTGAAFAAWVRERVPELSGVDPWGSPYRLQHSSAELTVTSSGQDGVPETEDDLSQTVRF
jgi:hypothetical protein